MDIESNVRSLEQRIVRVADKVSRSPKGVTIVAVTKTIGLELIEQAFKAGIKHFGENRVQEAEGKIAHLSHLQPPPTWHMVGHLQSNKVKVAAELFAMIHSVDSIRLAEALSHHIQHNIPILLQVNVSGEASKSGFAPGEVPRALEQIAHLPHLEIKGLMTIAPLANNPEEIRPIFRQLRLLRDSLDLEHLSMGMSDDFEVAIEEGTTIVRIGRAIFGERRD